MMKNKVIANTINYLAILLFVNVFALIFGRGNTLIGVTIVVAVSILKLEDMTKNFYGNLLKLLFINLISGIFAHLASHNIYLGLILNFSILLVMGYTLTSSCVFLSTKVKVRAYKSIKIIYLLPSVQAEVDAIEI